MDNTNGDEDLQVVLPKDKYDKLISEFQKLKQQLSVLKKAYLGEQKKSTDALSELQIAKDQLKEKVEEVDILSFNNRRLEKQLTQLMFDFEEKNKQQQSSFSSFSLTNLFKSNLNTPSESNQEVEAKQQDNSSLQQQIAKLKEELEFKVKENENVHMQIFELKTQHDSKIQELKSQIQQLQTESQAQTLQLQKFAALELDWKQKEEILQQNLSETQNLLKEKQTSEIYYKDIASHYQTQNNQLQEFIARKLPFDDTKHMHLNQLNLFPFNLDSNAKKLDLYDKLFINSKQCMKSLGVLYATCIQKLSLQTKTDSKNTFLKLLQKMDWNQVHQQHFQEFSNESETLLKSIKQSKGELYLIENDQIKEFSETLKKVFKFHSQTFLWVVVSLQEKESFGSKESLFEYHQKLKKQDHEEEEDYSESSEEEEDSLTSHVKYQQFQDVYLISTKLTRDYANIVDLISDFISMLQEFTNMTKHSTTSSAFSSTKPSRGRSNSILIFNEGIEFFEKEKKQNTKKGWSVWKEEWEELVQKFNEQFASFYSHAQYKINMDQSLILVSQNIKSMNEKIISSLGSFCSHLGKCTEQFKEILELETLSQAVVSRGIVCQFNQPGYFENVKLQMKIMEEECKDYHKMLQEKLELDLQTHQQETVNLKEALETKKKLEDSQKEVNKLKHLIEEVKKQQEHVSEAYKNAQDLVNTTDAEFTQTFVEFQLFVENSVISYLKSLPTQQPLWKDLDLTSKMLSIDMEEDSLQTKATKLFSNFKSIQQCARKAMEVLLKTVKQFHSKSNKIISQSHSEEDVTTLKKPKLLLDMNDTSPEPVVVEKQPVSNTTSQQLLDEFVLEQSTATKYSFSKISNNSQQEDSLIQLLTDFNIDREQMLQQQYDKKIKYLLKQIEVCDLKTLEFQNQWQQAIMELEQAKQRESSSQIQLEQMKQMLENVQDELHTTKTNYDTQIQLLSDRLAGPPSMERKQSMSGMSGSGFMHHRTSTSSPTPSAASNAIQSTTNAIATNLFDFFNKARN